MYALVKETNPLTLPSTPTPNPNRARRNRISSCCKPSWEKFAALVRIVITVLAYCHGQRIRLHHVIAGLARHTVFVRPVMDDGRAASEIVMRRRRRGRPL